MKGFISPIHLNERLAKPGLYGPNKAFDLYMVVEGGDKKIVPVMYEATSVNAISSIKQPLQTAANMQSARHVMTVSVRGACEDFGKNAQEVIKKVAAINAEFSEMGDLIEDSYQATNFVIDCLKKAKNSPV